MSSGSSGLGVSLFQRSGMAVWFCGTDIILPFLELRQTPDKLFSEVKILFEALSPNM